MRHCRLVHVLEWQFIPSAHITHEFSIIISQVRKFCSGFALLNPVPVVALSRNQAVCVCVYVCGGGARWVVVWGGAALGGGNWDAAWGVGL